MNEKLNNVIIKIEPINSKDNIDNSMENINDVIKSLNENKYVSDIIFSYNIHNHTKYAQFEMLAIDKVCGGGKKLYLGFKTKADKIKFIQSYKYKNLYEIIINEIVKPYFDIDYKKPQEYKTDEEVKIILHAFIIEFNKFFRLPITSDNIYCYAKRDDDTNLIKSIHIVISGFKATKDAMKEMVNAINKQRKPNSFKKMVVLFSGTWFVVSTCQNDCHGVTRWSTLGAAAATPARRSSLPTRICISAVGNLTAPDELKVMRG